MENNLKVANFSSMEMPFNSSRCCSNSSSRSSSSIGSGSSSSSTTCTLVDTMEVSEQANQLLQYLVLLCIKPVSMWLV